MSKGSNKERERLIKMIYKAFPETKDVHKQWIEMAVDAVLGRGRAYRTWKRGLRKYSYYVGSKSFAWTNKFKSIIKKLGFKELYCRWNRGYYVCFFVHPTKEEFEARLYKAIGKTSKKKSTMYKKILSELESIKHNIKLLNQKIERLRQPEKLDIIPHKEEPIFFQEEYQNLLKKLLL